jgi:tetratricopeptide (TPR) repeat protein
MIRAFGALATLAVASMVLAATPAERKIEAARSAIAKEPGRAGPYNALAMALASRARETADPRYYARGEEAVAQSLKLEPGNLEGLRAQVWLSLGQHQFDKAREQAVALNKKVPDDLLTYAFLVDANAELGRYDEAEKAAQWLLDMRPGNVPGLTRAAYLRELFGDLEGALEMMNKAFQRTDPAETEDQAWILAHVSHLQLLMGQIEVADAAAQEALRLFPKYHYALGSLGKVRMQQGRYQDAVEFYRRLHQEAPHPENLYELGKALLAAGEAEEAAKVFARFESEARGEMKGPDNSNRELVFYYVDVARKPEEALRVAELEISRRKDVYTLDAYAWALFAAGKVQEADTQMKQALKVGVKDPGVLSHARAILEKLKAGSETNSRASVQ